ncbi:MAG: transporter, partial [Pirellulaceae bacterium]
MSRPLLKLVAVLQIGLVFFTGCHPTQPFFVARDEARADYIMQSMDIEYSDVHNESLPEAAQSQTPLGPGVEPTGFVDLSLEDAVSMALNNTKIMRVVNGSSTQSGSVAAQGLSAQPGTLPSIYDPGVVATTANSQPLAVDGQGNRIISRGLIRSNQVGGVEDALSEFDAQFSALMGYSTTDRPRNVGSGNVFNPQFFQAVDGNAQAALSKRLATGTVATARFSTIYSRNNIPAPGLGRAVP